MKDKKERNNEMTEGMKEGKGKAGKGNAREEREMKGKEEGGMRGERKEGGGKEERKKRAT